MTTVGVNQALRRTTGGLFVAGALAFGAAATVLSSTFDWPDVLREAAAGVRPARRPAGAGRRGAPGVRRRWDEPGVDLVRHRLDLRPAAGADPAAAGGT